MATVERPHLRFPFKRGANGKVVVVEQDTGEHVASCEGVIARCRVGFRVTRPEFGWQFPTFRGAPIGVEDLVRALNEFEPRSEATAEEYADLADAATRHIAVTLPVEEDENG